MKTRLELLGRRLEILATDNGFGNHQIMLRHESSPGNLARLCDTARHNHELHWHYFEDMPGLTEEVIPATQQLAAGALTTGESLFADVFAPAMNVVRGSYFIQEGIF